MLSRVYSRLLVAGLEDLLQALNERSFKHGNLKPENIFIKFQEGRIIMECSDPHTNLSLQKKTEDTDQVAMIIETLPDSLQY